MEFPVFGFLVFHQLVYMISLEIKGQHSQYIGTDKGEEYFSQISSFQIQDKKLLFVFFFFVDLGDLGVRPVEFFAMNVQTHCMRLLFEMRNMSVI